MKLRGSDKSFARQEEGATAIEFAMAAPLVICLLFATFQFGWAYHCASSVQFALVRASRTLMVNADADQEDVRTTMQSFLEDVASDDFDVVLEPVTINGSEFSRVTSTYVHPVIIPFVPAFDLHFTAVQVVSRPES